jgi:transposase-like protein
MKKKELVCPKCGKKEKQIRAGYTKFRTERGLCKDCNYKYTINPKQRAYPEKLRSLAIKEYMAGLSARAVGKIHGMSGNNVLYWIKKTGNSVDKSKN